MRHVLFLGGVVVALVGVPVTLLWPAVGSPVLITGAIAAVVGGVWGTYVEARAVRRLLAGPVHRARKDEGRDR